MPKDIYYMSVGIELIRSDDKTKCGVKKNSLCFPVRHCYRGFMSWLVLNPSSFPL
jgi:hypothetical protein